MWQGALVCVRCQEQEPGASRWHWWHWGGCDATHSVSKKKLPKYLSMFGLDIYLDTCFSWQTSLFLCGPLTSELTNGFPSGPPSQARPDWLLHNNAGPMARIYFFLSKTGFLVISGPWWPSTWIWPFEGRCDTVGPWHIPLIGQNRKWRMLIGWLLLTAAWAWVDTSVPAIICVINTKYFTVKVFVDFGGFPSFNNIKTWQGEIH